MQENTVQKNTMKLGMIACCVVMFLPIIAFFAAGGTLAGVSGNLAAFAPLLLCVGAHLLMFKLMGKSCHGSEKVADPGPIVERPTTIPASGGATHTAVEHSRDQPKRLA